MEDNRLFLIDGMALIYRAYFGLIRNPRITSSGFNASAVFGYVNTINDLIKRYKPTHVAVAFDTSDPTFRHEEYKEYKANRDAMPEDLAEAIPYIFKVTEAFNIPILRYPGFEADDIIGTLATKATELGLETYMVTPDKDFAQLVSDSVKLYKPGRDGIRILGVPEILENWGISRIDQVIDILALTGDKVDNIPGVPGIGPKTAQKLIAEYDTVEGIIANVDKLKGKQKERIEDHQADALLSKRLVKIKIDCDVELDLDAFEMTDIDKVKMKEVFDFCEFRQLAKRMLNETIEVKPASITAGLDLFDYASGGNSSEQTDSEPIESNYKTIKDVKHNYTIINAENMDTFVEKLIAQDVFCFDIETTSSDSRSAEIVGFSFCWQAHEAYYLPIPDEPLLIGDLMDTIRKIMSTEALKVGHNLKFDLSVLRWHDIEVSGKCFDTMLASWLILPDMRQNLDFLSQFHLKYDPISLTSLIGEKGPHQKSPRDIEVEKMAEYAAEDADVTWQLKSILEPKIKEFELIDVFNMECQLIPVVVEIEHNGIAINDLALDDYSDTLADELESCKTVIYEQAGLEFNISSPKQIGEVLFDKLQLVKNPKRTKTGQYATNEQILQKLSGRFPIVADILEYRQMFKLKNTYVDTLPSYINPNTGRIHTHFNQAVAATGRMQSNNPNLQNIPIRSDRGKEIRHAFVASSEEFKLLAADYSQIELRIIAHISKDEGLVDAFKTGADIHSSTAAYVYNVPLEDVDPEMRRKSKMVNYGIAYGMTAFGLAQRLRIPMYEAKEIIERYFAAFPGISQYMEDTVVYAREHGFVKTLMGRRRYLRDINSRNHPSRSAAERNAINSPIQGTAADMIKQAMILVQNRLEAGQYKSRMLLQVHDELVFDLHRDEEAELPQLIVNDMADAMPLIVPVTVDYGIAENWLDAH